MGTTYLEAITPENHDCSDFHPKDNQKAVYKWYDSQYSDEAWDIYSIEWEARILEWHEAHQIALQETSTSLNTDEQLERLPFGKFFLAHPIAAFSLWRVLQACYGLDRAVCGETDEVASWQQLAPFQYLRDSSVEKKWQAELEQFKTQVTSSRLNVKKQSWELKVFNVFRGIETFEKEFAALRENFRVNLVDKKFGLWMMDRIEEDVGKRVAMITDLLKLKENELVKIQPIESHEDDINNADTFAAPGYSRTATFPPSYSSPRKSEFPHGTRKVENTGTPATETKLLQKPTRKGGLVSSIKKGFRKIKHKIRRPGDSSNPNKPR
ncbi:hypothetical protein IFR05_006730 [Cadophora sp. M221]|nr:hypothetical protein IFR05_006730 [Cadophora sp. M221]